MARGSRRLKALKSMVKQDISSDRFAKIMADHTKLRGTSRRGTRGRSGEDTRYNTALRILRAGESGMASIDTPGVKRAQKCMQRKMKGGQGLREAYGSCGLTDVKERSGVRSVNEETGEYIYHGGSLATSKGDRYWGDVRGRSGSRQYYGTNLGEHRVAAYQGRTSRRR